MSAENGNWEIDPTRLTSAIMIGKRVLNFLAHAPNPTVDYPSEHRRIEESGAAAMLDSHLNKQATVDHYQQLAEEAKNGYVEVADQLSLPFAPNTRQL